MFDIGKGRMIRTADVFFLVRVFMRGIWRGLEEEQVNQIIRISRGREEGVKRRAIE